MTEQYKRNPNTKCLICNKPIYKRPLVIKRNKGRVFCSSTCYGISCRKEKPCIVCGKPILAGLHKKTCSRKCANKHRAGIKYKINRPKDKVKHYKALKLRLLKIKGKHCERCGYPKYEILQIHHKDRVKTNNSLDNLELICPNCHAEEHYLENSWLNDSKVRWQSGRLHTP
jgi:predicted nucleic acid-binding Zn ribbon protein